MKDPLWPDIGHQKPYFAPILNIRFVHLKVVGNIGEPPAIRSVAEKQVHFMTVSQEPAGKVSSHEAGCASNEDALHTPA
jgi:hypothetical protein